MNEKLDQTLTSVFFTLLVSLFVLAAAKSGSLGQMKQFVFLVGVFSAAAAVIGAMLASRSKGFNAILFISLAAAVAVSAIILFAQAAGLI